MIKIIYKHNFNYDELDNIEFKTYESFGLWYTNNYKYIKVIDIKIVG